MASGIGNSRAGLLWLRGAGLVVAAGLAAAACSSGSIADLGADVTAPTDAPASSTAVSQPDQTTVTGAADPAAVTTQEPQSSTTATTELLQEPLPTSCPGIDTPILPTQLTYVADAKLIALDLAGDPQCLIDLGDDRGVDIVEWSAQADRVMFRDGRVDVLGDEGRVGGEAGPSHLGFSWPTAFNMVWLRDGVIQKSTIDARQLRALDVGSPVLGITYHPDGQHLFLVLDDLGSPGSRVIVTNTEAEGGVELLVSDDAKISEVVVASEGSTIVFSAEHANGAIHVHAFDLETAIVEVVVVDERGRDAVARVFEKSDEISVLTVFEAAKPVDDIVFDPSGEQIAFAVGDCRSGSQIELVDLVIGGYPLPIDPLFSARPVGFLTETQLAILVYDKSCVGGDLYIADTVTGATELVRADVDGAAVRRVEPPARFTLVDLVLALEPD